MTYSASFDPPKIDVLYTVISDGSERRVSSKDIRTLSVADSPIA
jgi:hypothetical protein